MRLHLFPLLCAAPLIGCASTTQATVTTTSAAPTVATSIASEPTMPTTPPTKALTQPKSCKTEKVPGTSFAPNKAEFNDVSGVTALIVANVTRIRNQGYSVTVDVTGHSDSQPTDAFGGNDGLSQARAQAVADALQQAGLPTDAIRSVAGKGDSEPIPDAPPGPDGDAMNRRVEIRISCQGGAA
jgi:outer membrane protein OmpA-like peptidoglycan-associated protein